VRAWWVTAALAAVLFGAISCGPQQGSPDRTDPGTAAPVSIIRRGNEITLSGDVPDPAAKRALLDAVITSTEDLTVIDRLRVAPGATAPDFSVSAPVFEAAAVIGDFTVRMTGDTVTLAGTAAKAPEAAAVADAAEDAWPRAEILNELVVSSPATR